MNVLKGFFFLILLSIAPSFAESRSLRPFAPDGCTLFSEGTRSKPNLWAHCCFEHDLYYWAGGTKEQRRSADLELRSCVQATGKRALAELMYRAVRMGRHSPIKVKSQAWGHAWEGKPRYRRLSQDEVAILASQLEFYDFPIELKRKLIDSFANFLN